MNIVSTIGELTQHQQIGRSGLVNGIMGIHIWTFSAMNERVLVKTKESWEGEPVKSQTEFLQKELNKSTVTTFSMLFVGTFYGLFTAYISTICQYC